MRLHFESSTELMFKLVINSSLGYSLILSYAVDRLAGTLKVYCFMFCNIVFILYFGTLNWNSEMGNISLDKG